MSIREIVNTTSCVNHGGKHGRPCWWVRSDKGGRLLMAICNRRARGAGATAPISDNSLRRNYVKKGK